MLVTESWLKEYVSFDMPTDDLTDRLTMTGLNLEGVENVDGETVIDLEVTSNRPDCLGHIGVAREIAVIFDQKEALKIPEAQVTTVSDKTADVTSVAIDSDNCHQYFARVIRGVKIGPSPEWLQQRLKSVGVAVVNNVVDISKCTIH